MPLTAIETKPTPGLGWWKRLYYPSKDETLKAWQELHERCKEEHCPPVNPLAWEFLEGRLKVGTKLIMDGRSLVLMGVYKCKDFPGAMVFWDHSKGRYVQFTGALFPKYKIMDN